MPAPDILFAPARVRLVALCLGWGGRLALAQPAAFYSTGPNSPNGQ